MFLMLKQKKPDNYVLATNESHSIKELIEEACAIGGISSKTVISSKKNFRINDVEHLQGDYKKTKKHLGWKPKTNFKKLVKIMVEEVMFNAKLCFVVTSGNRSKINLQILFKGATRTEFILCEM
jgi:GDP-D-mannose dehydratase